MPLTDADLRVLSYIEQTYWEAGEVPTNELISQRLGLELREVERIQRKDEVKAVLTERAMPCNADQELMTPQQILGANIIFNSYDTRSMREKLKGSGITLAQLNAWMRQPAFIRYIEKRADYEFGNLETETRITIRNQIRAGSLEAVKYYNEMRGIYNPRQDANIDVAGLVLKIMEILGKHVASEVLMKVAQELEMLGPNVLTSTPVGIIETRETEEPFKLRL